MQHVHNVMYNSHCQLGDGDNKEAIHKRCAQYTGIFHSPPQSSFAEPLSPPRERPLHVVTRQNSGPVITYQ